MPNVPKIVIDRMRTAPSVAHHPDAGMLTAFAERSLPTFERDAVLEHLGRCSECRDVVALALPEIATQPVTLPTRAGWLTWPVLRWGLVAAGIVAVASFGILQYHERTQPTANVVKQPPSEVAANLQVPTAAPAATENKENKRIDKAANAGQSLAPTDVLSDAKKKKDEAPRVIAPAAPAPQIPARVSGLASGIGGTIGGPTTKQPPFGPKMPVQWQQQQSLPKVQLPAATPSHASASGDLNVQAAGAATEASTETAALEAPQPSQALDFSRAKPPVTAAYAGAINQTGQDQAVLRSPMQVSPGEMGGYVVDPTGAVIPNARITVTPSNPGEAASVITDAQGRWLIAGLPSGNYNAQAQAQGFQMSALNFTYDANHPSLYNFPLSIGSASETVSVTSAQGVLQTETAQVEGTIPSRVPVSQAALNGRNFTQLITLTPAPRWSISSKGLLQRSLDQGKTWQDVDVNSSLAPAVDTTSAIISGEPVPARKKAATAAPQPAAIVFRAVAANGPDVWAGGSSGLLCHSLDAGNHWTRVLPQAAGVPLTSDVVSLQFPDPQHGRIRTSTGETWITGDAGQTWQRQ
jgi:hypothetical protein